MKKMTKKLNWCEIEFKCKAGMDHSRCKFAPETDECRHYSVGYCCSVDAQQAALTEWEIMPEPTDFCTELQNHDEALQILSEIEAVSVMRWCDGGESPSEWVPRDYPIWIACDCELFTQDDSGKKMSAEEFVAECAKRMPK
jgi:hypothetical protein